MEEHISNLENIQDNMLNKLKSNIVNWYNFTRVGSILVLGNIDICVIEYLSKKFEKVVVVTKSINKLNELLKLSEISKNSLTIFEDISNIVNDKFDYIFIIDYLNYENSNEKLIKELLQIGNFLNDNGKILMALKNNLGAMQIINRTYKGFSKARINKIIKDAHFEFFKYYYILPEIEQVNVIFSDEFLPTLNDLRRNNHFSKEQTQNGRLENEFFVKVLKNDNSDFKTVANAYFIEISKNKINNDIKAVFYNNIRPERFRLKTTIYKNYAVKESVCDDLEHLNNIKKNIDILKQCKINSLDEYDDTKIKSNILKNAQRFDDRFIELFKSDEEKALELIEKFKNEILLKLEKTDSENTVFKKYEIDDVIKELTFIKHGFWDMTFQNVFVENDKLFVYDQEWYEENIPLEFIIYRSILILDALSLEEKEKIYKKLQIDKYKESFNELEKRIQKSITNEPMLSLYANTLIEEKINEINNDLSNVERQVQISNVEKEMPICLKDCKIIKGIIKVSGRFTLKLFRKSSKFLYNRIPKKLKRKIKNKIEYSNKLSKITGIPMAASYNLQPMRLYDKTSEQNIDVYSQITLNKSIGIHLHLYYEDLAQEFYNYLCNIPYEFDLYISIRKDSNPNKIRNVFKRIVNLNKLEVLQAENCGRDFGPMFVMFAKDLKKYDYIMHIHSKKSLRTGTEQTDWRQYLLNNLLGSTERIMKCFYLMEEKNVGLVYPDSHSSIPYWSYTWMNEARLAREIYKKLKIKYEERFLEFSAGSMFWAKREALEPLLDLDLTWEDFGKDVGQTGGTLEYVFEKIPGTVTRHQGYNIAIYNQDRGEFLLNEGIKNLDQYYAQNIDTITKHLMQFDVITFDIFDTLITRKVCKPDDVFKILEKRLVKEKILENYFELRKKAETNIRIKKEFKGDCTIDEIYDEFSNIANVSKELAEDIKQMEIQLELEMCIPRKDVLEIYNKLIKADKKIILISDMYLTKKYIEKILNNCGYYNYSEIWVSSEMGKRKDDGTMWGYFVEKYKSAYTVHVGDNEEADMHKPVELGRNITYFMRGQKLYEQSSYDLKKEFNLDESVVLGNILNKVLFNSPFALYNNENNAIVNNEFKYGYAIAGPIILEYFRWLLNSLINSKENNVLLFAAREGYYLQKIYNHLIEKLNIEKLRNIENHYLYISRRSISVAAIETKEDIYEIMKKSFKGTLKGLFYNRLGFKENSLGDNEIELPRDFELVKNVIDLRFDKIMKNVKYEKENYLEYIDGLISDKENKKLNFIDLGYSGTAQYYLSKLLNQKITGKYFAVYKDLKPLSIGCEVESCFNKDIHDVDEILRNPIYEYSILLEAFLTAPQGQFQYFDKTEEGVKPIFNSDDNSEKVPYFEKIYSAIIEYIDDIVDVFKEGWLNIEFDKNILIDMYQNFVVESEKLDANMKKFFDIDDYYCFNQVINGVDSCQFRLKR